MKHGTNTLHIAFIFLFSRDIAIENYYFSEHHIVFSLRTVDSGSAKPYNLRRNNTDSVSEDLSQSEKDWSPSRGERQNRK
jgi:hypothetical protein